MSAAAAVVGLLALPAEDPPAHTRITLHAIEDTERHKQHENQLRTQSGTSSTRTN